MDAPQAAALSTPTAPAAVVGADHVLTEGQVASFRRDGFVVAQGLACPSEMAALLELYDRLFSERRGWSSGEQFDMVGDDGTPTELALPQLMWPSRYEPSLRRTALASMAAGIARQLLGPGAQNILEHAIRKPAFNGAATPWHQDDAFNRPGSGFVEQISIWMPLQDATIESGCMRYIRGSHLGPLLPHRSPGNDPRIQGLEIRDPPDLTQCVAAPVRAGGAVIHHSRTLHSAGTNTASEPRRAYILGYSVQTRTHSLLLTRDYPWNLEKRTARAQRELEALPPLKRAVRRIRRLLRGQRF